MINRNINCKLRCCLELFGVPDLISDNFIVAFMKGKDTTKHLDFRDPWNLIVLVKGVMRKIVGSDLRFNILSANHLQGQGTLENPCECGDALGPVSRKSRKRFGPQKTFVTLRPAYSVKLVFSYVVKGMKIITTANFRGPRRLRFEDTKIIMSPQMRTKSSWLLRNRPLVCVVIGRWRSNVLVVRMVWSGDWCISIRFVSEGRRWL